MSLPSSVRLHSRCDHHIRLTRAPVLLDQLQTPPTTTHQAPSPAPAPSLTTSIPFGHRTLVLTSIVCPPANPRDPCTQTRRRMRADLPWATVDGQIRRRRFPPVVPPTRRSTGRCGSTPIPTQAPASQRMSILRR
ncbi:extensin-1-like [Iris pallida]|uniref:Extensin-1-like n=1 Tax=Iris pallida TaxID=29817 RepID=A0AAX6G9H2_IRIPA|nr:extensin-1-like [Iris pallida]